MLGIPLIPLIIKENPGLAVHVTVKKELSKYREVSIPIDALDPTSPPILWIIARSETVEERRYYSI